MTVQDLSARMRGELSKVLFGQDEGVTQVLSCLLAQGHVLLEGVPGLAKTLLAKALAATLGGEFRRVQFTPDLMPSDITGVSVLQPQEGTFVFRPGPVFCNVLLADEINRTPPKTQAALLQAMEERFVSADGQDRPLPDFFFVMATQNPVEYEGTYPLPEAQLDRFLMKVVLSYPAEENEVQILRSHHQGKPLHELASSLTKVAELADLLEASRSLKNITLEDSMYRYITALVRKSRETRQVVLGASPRAGIALMQTAKAVAAMEGRGYVTPDDVKVVAPAVLRHRLILRPEAELEGQSADRLVAGLLAAVPVPR